MHARAFASFALATALLACTPPRTAPMLRTGGEHRDLDHAAVVFLSTDCSGVLIAPRRVLTAAHCVAGEAEIAVQSGAWRSAVTRCRMHPSAIEPASDRCAGAAHARTGAAHDFAMLTLPLDAPTYIAPIPVWIEPIEALHGRVARLVGYHRHPSLIGPARRYSGENVVDDVDGDLFRVRPLPDRFTTRIGASGGPALLAIGGREHVVGILFGGERSDSDDSIYAATFTPENARWIAAQAPEAFGRELPAF